ncbi:LLM class flavin-dependent oxidoreductase [Streptomyces phyllanthi]|uniref:LLM class flavin-dependent oxidoreductase n=1 Tax=Streptomyces phyllanthi TaxID=1803180 RepID=A0A5N8WB49_9ACTN|nr:LLM class flavin-dependent oxidoreductase [Streptomyces phyllanthi]MPY43658.1 LLM class flavin-dependent oxidoreductase [Streptomyces phyllanthi]
MAMELACTFSTSIATPEHIRIAEELGYVSAWCHYSPAIYADPWMMLALASERTTRIGLGVAVVVPRFRHVADVAGCTATLTQLAPGRVTVAVGSGFSSTALLGGRGTTWASVEAFVTNLRALLGGERIELDGRSMSLLHSKESGISLPIEVPIWVAAHGPKAFGVASRVADGVITNPTHGNEKIPFEGTCGLSYYGTVLDPGEAFDDPAVIERVGPTAALALHMGPYGPLSGSVEEKGFTEQINALPEEDRLVATHRGHLISLTDLDRRFLNGNVVRDGTLSGTPAEIRAGLDALEEAGASRFCYTPAGSDIPRELEAFAKAFHL